MLTIQIFKKLCSGLGESNLCKKADYRVVGMNEEVFVVLLKRVTERVLFDLMMVFNSYHSIKQDKERLSIPLYAIPGWLNSYLRVVQAYFPVHAFLARLGCTTI